MNNNPNLTKADLEKLLIGAIEYTTLEEKYTSLRTQMSTFAGLMKSQFDKLRSQNIRFDYESNLNQLLTGEGIQISHVNGIANIIDYREKVIEVPIQDSRTKHLIHMFASQMKKFFDKYPKLQLETDVRLTEFFQQELIDVIEAD